MNNNLDPKIMPEYLISAGISYSPPNSTDVEITNFSIKQLQKYEVSKDSTKYNYNIHMLTLTAITELEFLDIKNKDNWINIELKDKTGKVFSNKRFKMLVTNILQEQDQMYNLQIVMMSELPYLFMHSHKYGKISTLNSSTVKTRVTAHEILSNLLRQIQTDSTNNLKIQCHWNDSGKLNKQYESIRIPESYNDIEIFQYLFKIFPPYLFEPYFIFDDFHFPKNKVSAPYNIIINNLFDIISTYDQISMKNLDRINSKTRKFISSVPLINHDKFYKLIRSTLILNDGINNLVSKVSPLINSTIVNNRDNVKNIETTLDKDLYIKQLQAKKILVDKNSSIESYSYANIEIDDISFLSVYNITDNKIYDHLPLTIEYSFLKNQYNSFWINVNTQYAKIPNKLY